MNGFLHDLCAPVPAWAFFGIAFCLFAMIVLVNNRLVELEEEKKKKGIPICWKCKSEIYISNHCRTHPSQREHCWKCCPKLILAEGSPPREGP